MRSDLTHFGAKPTIPDITGCSLCSGKIYISWLFLVTLAFMYNAIVIPLRGVFPYQTVHNLNYWLIGDYLCDGVYLIDILLFKCRLRFANNGIVEVTLQSAQTL